MLITSRMLFQSFLQILSLSNIKFLVPVMIVKHNEYWFLLTFQYLKKHFLTEKEKHTPTSVSSSS